MGHPEVGSAAVNRLMKAKGKTVFLVTHRQGAVALHFHQVHAPFGTECSRARHLFHVPRT